MADLENTPTDDGLPEEPVKTQHAQDAVVQEDAVQDVAVQEDAVQDVAVLEDPVQEDAAQASADAPPARTASGRGRTITLVSLRVVRGLVGAAAAAVVIGAVGLVPLPTVGIDPLAVTVEPPPADMLQLCTGSLLRLGDDSGSNAGQASPVGTADVTVAADGGTATTTPLAQSDAGTGGTRQAPSVLTLAASPDAALAGAQTQVATGAGDLSGLAASACAEPTSSAWLVGGAATIGRTTLLLIANPTAVSADVTIRMWSETGAVSAPGMAIEIPAGQQKVLPLAGFAPGIASPVVHVEARGGQIVAALQTSVVRVLDPGGVDVNGAGAAPSTASVVPAVRIFDELGVSSSLGLADHEDLEAIARVGNPGDADATVEVSLLPVAADGPATSFEITVPAGTVTDVPLSTALELGQAPFPDGSYSVSFQSDVPVVTGVRASTTPAPAADAGGIPQAGPVDLAWFSSAPALHGDALIAVADAPSPMLVAVNPDNTERTLTLEPLGGGDTVLLVLPPARPAAIALTPGEGYRVLDADGVRVGITFAGPGALAGYTLRSAREADSPIVVRP